MARPARLPRDLDIHRGDPYALQWTVRSGGVALNLTIAPVPVFRAEIKDGARNLVTEFTVDTSQYAAGIVFLTLTPEQTLLLPDYCLFDVQESVRWRRTLFTGRINADDDYTD